MKPLTKKLLALATAAAVTLSIMPTVHATEAEPAVSVQWASLEAPAMEELIPARIRTASTDASLTRRGLCEMTMNVYKSVTGLTAKDLDENQHVFIDSCDRDVLSAYALGFVTADDSGFFFPAETVTRQDFFTCAVQLLDTIGYAYTNDIKGNLDKYPDADELMDYAVQPVRVLRYTGAIGKNDPLEPNRQITASEAVLIMDRVVSFFYEWQENPVDPNRYVGEDIAALAHSKVGCSYVYGAHGPRKFDCSGLVYWVYKQYGYDLKPGARNQWSMLGKTVKKANLLPGDLLFFSDNGKSSGIFHVGIYIGNGKFVHAANPRKGVITTNMDESWYASRYLGAKRAIK